mgnify:FL=1
MTAAPAVQQPATMVQSTGSSIQSNHILMVIVGGIVLGFAFGLGNILAQKATKKTVVIQDPLTSSANGMQMPMYPPRDRQGRIMPPPNHGYNRDPRGYNGGGYHGANGERQFDPNAWLNSGSKPMNINEIAESLGTVQD